MEHAVLRVHSQRGDRLAEPASIIELAYARLLSWCSGAVVERKWEIPRPPQLRGGYSGMAELPSSGYLLIILGDTSHVPRPTVKVWSKSMSQEARDPDQPSSIKDNTFRSGC